MPELWPILIGIMILLALWAIHVVSEIRKTTWKQCRHCCWWFSDDGRIATAPPLGATTCTVLGVCRDCDKRARNLK